MMFLYYRLLHGSAKCAHTLTRPSPKEGMQQEAHMNHIYIYSHCKTLLSRLDTRHKGIHNHNTKLELYNTTTKQQGEQAERNISRETIDTCLERTIIPKYTAVPLATIPIFKVSRPYLRGIVNIPSTKNQQSHKNSLINDLGLTLTSDEDSIVFSDDVSDILLEDNLDNLLENLKPNQESQQLYNEEKDRDSNEENTAKQKY